MAGQDASSPAHPLNAAIADALRAPAYDEKGILVAAVLEATAPLDADDSLLYRSVYTIFRALPDRLLDGTTLHVATSDLPEGGVELTWEAREALHEPDTGKDLRTLMGHGPHGDLMEIALRALEGFCNVRAGFVETRRDRVLATSFDRPAHIVRRVTAVIPARGALEGAPASIARSLRERPAEASRGGTKPPPGRSARIRPLVARLGAGGRTRLS